MILTLLCAALNHSLHAGRDYLLACFFAYLRRVEHLSAEVLELGGDHRGSSAPREEQVVILAGVEVRVRVFVEIAFAFESWLEVRWVVDLEAGSTATQPLADGFG